MRFMLFVIDDGSHTATPDEGRNIDDFNDRLRAEGHWVMAAGIAGPAAATVVDYTGDQPTEVPGSRFDDPEFFSGFWIVDAADQEQALQLARAGSRACNRKVEVRPFLR